MVRGKKVEIEGIFKGFWEKETERVGRNWEVWRMDKWNNFVNKLG